MTTFRLCRPPACTLEDQMVLLFRHGQRSRFLMKTGGPNGTLSNTQYIECLEKKLQSIWMEFLCQDRQQTPTPAARKARNAELDEIAVF
mmetsp:Transcript_33527/g.77303  ORF Transcript_33527/g.77303 Transcript_33527/m.77303 type:complete len:89 (-) Transcript_33527:325-591(-)